MSTRILLVDDHQTMREGMRLIIGRQEDMTVVGESANGLEALDRFTALVPDLVLMDIQMRDMNGIEATRRILAQFPEARVVILSALPEPALVDQALRAGVRGYLLKSSSSDEVIWAIRAVMAGKIFLCPEVATPVLTNYRKQLESATAPPKPRLSEREREVLRLTAQGLRAKEIADKLGIGVRTVETYRTRLMTKLNCGGSVELTRYAIREGIVTG